jgi:CheY-like chemotaxis protein
VRVERSILSVLIVEDDLDHADLLAEFIGDCEHRVLVARSAKEALAIAKTGNLDLIFVDLVMPEHDGFDLVRTLRESGLRCRIVATTGLGGKEAQLRASHSGVDAFLLKPFPLIKIKAELDAVALSLERVGTRTTDCDPA